MPQWMMETTKTSTRYTNRTPFGRSSGTGLTLVLAIGHAQFETSYDRDTKRMNTINEYTTAFLTEDGHFEPSKIVAGELIFFLVFTSNPALKLPSNDNTNDEIILTNNSLDY